MANKNIIIKPVISEKAERLSEGNIAQYTFLVRKDANKIEIGKAIEELYNVGVDSVNTMIIPGKTRVRSTRSGFVRGATSAYKKAVVTLAEGEFIDVYGEDEFDTEADTDAEA